MKENNRRIGSGSSGENGEHARPGPFIGYFRTDIRKTREMLKQSLTSLVTLVG